MLNQLHIVGSVTATAVCNNKLYLIGAFSQILGQPRQNFAVVSLIDGTLDPFNPVFGGTSPTVLSICITNSGNVVVAGNFSSISHSSIPGGSMPASGIAYINTNNGLISSIPVVVPIYPEPSNPFAQVFSNLAPVWGMLKYNSTTNTVYASMQYGGIMDTVANQPVFGIAAFDGTTLGMISGGGLGIGYQTVLYTNFVSYPIIPGYPWNTPSPMLVPALSVNSFDLDITNQNIYAALINSSFDSSGNPNQINRYSMANRNSLTSSPWYVGTYYPSRIFFKNNNIFIFGNPSTTSWGPSLIYVTGGSSVSVNGGAFVTSTANPTTSSITAFNVAYDSPVTKFGFLRTVYDIEVNGNEIIFYGDFTSIGGVPGHNVLALDTATYSVRQNRPLNTMYYLYGGYDGPPSQQLWIGQANAHFRDTDGKLHVFGSFPQIGGSTTSDTAHLIMDSSANIPQTRILI